VIPPNPRATRRCARKKGGTGLKVPLFKGDLGGSSLWLLATGLFKHPLRLMKFLVRQYSRMIIILILMEILRHNIVPWMNLPPERVASSKTVRVASRVKPVF
jgi:hypothetical protein